MATTIAPPSRHSPRSHAPPRPGRTDVPQRLTQALGWFGIGLGLAQLLAPRVLARAVGVPRRSALLRVLGVREIVSGAIVLRQRIPTGGLALRLAGDAIDLALLGAAARSPSSRPDMRTLAAVAGIAALDLWARIRQGKRLAAAGLAPGESRVEKCITINRPADDCYRFWRDFERFPRFMKQVESVRLLSPASNASLAGQRSHWRARGPAGLHVDWEAEVTTDRPAEEIAWRSVAGSDVEHAGSVRFERAPGGEGTVVWVVMSYRPFGFRLGALMARIFPEESDRRVEADLRRVKQLLETGEIATTAGQPAGPRTPLMRLLSQGVEA